MKKSINAKLVLLFTIVMVVLLGSSWITMAFLFPTYSQHSKMGSLASVYSRVKEVSDGDQEDGGKLSDDSTLTLEMLGANQSMEVYLFQVSYFYGQMVYTFDYPSSGSAKYSKLSTVKDKTFEYVLADLSKDYKVTGKDVIRSGKGYKIYRTYDDRIGSYYLELFGKSDAGEYIYLRTNYQSMRESMRVSNRFLVYVVLAVAVLGMITLIFISNFFTRPIVLMTGIARQMAQLDFEAKYPVDTEDEIGQLGHSLNQLSEQLEGKIEELKTANNALQRDIEKKTQIDEMRKDFLSNVSHELKTPIALIQGYAEGLYDNVNDDPESRAFYCEVIMDEASKMNKMVKKLITLNQIEFGNDLLNFERFDLVQVINSVIASADILAKQKGATLTPLDETSCYVWADEYMVEEVITNYISNAINHVEGEMQIRTWLEYRDEVVRVNVFNTGRQIPEEELDKIWIKFYKVDKARTREYGGSGIGLSIVKAIVESMNQQCGVCNQEDGVLFWFELDRRKS